MSLTELRAYITLIGIMSSPAWGFFLDCDRLVGMRHVPVTIRCAIAAVGLAGLAAAGCSITPSLKTLAKTPQGTVWIEQLSERGSSATWGGQTRSFQATHPISLNPDVIDKFLEGIRIQAHQGPKPTQRPVDPQATTVLSQEARAFLTPAIAQGLAQASYDQRIHFRIYHHHTATESEITVGTLFVNRPTIQLTLKRYRTHSSFTAATGLEGREVAFVPETARVWDAAPQSWVLVEPHLYTVAVNYETLATLSHLEPGAAPTAAPPDSPRPGSPSSGALSDMPSSVSKPAEDIQGMKDTLSRQDKELDALREELRSMQRQLSDRPSDGQPAQPTKKQPSPTTSP